MGAAQASDYLENKLIDHLFRAGTFAKPTALWVALFTGSPADAGGGTEVDRRQLCAREPGAVRYQLARHPGRHDRRRARAPAARPPMPSSSAFPAPTATWGTVSHFGIFDAATAGNLLIWDALTVARPILSGDPAPTFNIDALTCGGGLMAFDAHKNLAISTVVTAPTPATSGTTLTVTAGEGARFPAPPFNATVWPSTAMPDAGQCAKWSA